MSDLFLEVAKTDHTNLPILNVKEVIKTLAEEKLYLIFI